jgi:kynurenine formamidase
MDIPTEQEVLSYFEKLCNWGRWGSDDQRGTLNLISPQKTQQALSLATEGTSISCARTIQFDSSLDSQFPPIHFMLESGDGLATGDKVTNRSIQAASDFIGMAFHGFTITHLDSLSHIFWEGKMYNGRPSNLVSTSLGATIESVVVAKTGILTRGVLVDVPMIRGINWLERGEGVMPEDILTAEKQCGFKVEEGDVLFIRTGQLHRRNTEGPVDIKTSGGTACQAACLPLFHERGIAMIAADTGNDVIPSGYQSIPSPIHQVGIVAMGLWILDNPDLEELAKACSQRNRWEFLITINPLPLHNTTGSPVNPVAIF